MCWLATFMTWSGRVRSVGLTAVIHGAYFPTSQSTIDEKHIWRLREAPRELLRDWPLITGHAATRCRFGREKAGCRVDAVRRCLEPWGTSPYLPYLPYLAAK